MRWIARGALVLVFAAMFSVAGGAVLSNSSPVYAEPRPIHDTSDEEDEPGSNSCSTKPRLLGVFVPWYQYLPIYQDDTGSCAVRDFTILPDDGKDSDIPLVALAIVDDLLRLAGLVAVIFVIYGGIQYVTSQGNPDAASKAQSTIMNALIGLVISMVAIAFVTFIGRSIG